MSKMDKSLSVADFAITKDNKPKAVFIFTDLEPDDIQAIIILSRFCCGLDIPLWIISGSADNEIQNKRAEKYIKFGLANSMPGGKDWLTANVHFLKGVGSKDIPPGLGADILSPEELKKSTDSQPDIAAIQKALVAHPQCCVFCIKKPDELLALLALPAKTPLFSHAMLITYTGGFNYQAPDNASLIGAHQDGIRALFNAFEKVGIVQNYHMLQGADRNDKTTRDIMPAHTPKFVQKLREDKSSLGEAIRNSIRGWNEKTILDMRKKVGKFATDKGADHDAGKKILADIFQRDSLVLDEKTLGEIKAAVQLLDESDAQVGFRKKMWLNVLDNMEVQCVIADQLAAFVVCHPDAFSSPGVPGTLNFTKDGFIEVKPAEGKEAKCLCFPPIAGQPGKPQDGGTRILAVDNFLCEMVLRNDLHLGSTSRVIAGKSQQQVVTQEELETRLSALIRKQQRLVAQGQKEKPISWELLDKDGQPCVKMMGGLISSGGEAWFQKALRGITISFISEPRGMALIVHNVDAASFTPAKSALTAS